MAKDYSHGVNKGHDHDNNQPSVEAESIAENRFCMAAYYNYVKRENRKRESLARHAIDTATRRLKFVNDIIEEIKNLNLNQVFFTNKHLGTTAFLTMLSNNYRKYRFLKFSPEKIDGYYVQLKFFVKKYLNCYNSNLNDTKTRDLIISFFDLIIYEESILYDVAEFRRVLKFCGLDILGKNHLNWDETDTSKMCEELSITGNSKLIDFLNKVEKLYKKIKDYIAISYGNSIDKEPIEKPSLLKSIRKQSEKLRKEIINSNYIEEKYKADIKIWGTGYTDSDPTMILIDDFDVAFVELFNDGIVKLDELHKLRSVFIKELNTNNLGGLRQFVLVLQKQYHTNTYEVFCKGCQKTSLRKLWRYHYFDTHRGVFFVELLWHIKNKKAQDIYDAQFKCNSPCKTCPLRVNEQLLSRIDSLIAQEGENDNARLEWLVNKDNEEKNRIDELIGEKLSGLVDICEGNPYFIIRPIMQVIGDNYNCMDEKGCIALDNNVKAYFKKENGWDYDDYGSINKINSHSFSDFFDMLPLYLSEKLQDSGGDFIDSKLGVNGIEDVKIIAGKWLACMIKHISRDNLETPDGASLKVGEVCTTLSRYVYKDSDEGCLLKKERKYLKTHKEIVPAIIDALKDSYVIYGDTNVQSGEPIVRKIKLSRMLLKKLRVSGSLCIYRRINKKNYKNDLVKIYNLNRFIRYIYSDDKIFEKNSS